MQRIAVIGAKGQLGSDLMKVLPHAIPLTHEQIDIVNQHGVNDVLNQLRPEILINTAAYNLVDKAEDDSATAFQVNAIGPENLAHWCHSYGATLVHVSTDYVFGADHEHQTPYTEDDVPAPVNVYGRSKLAGESAVQRHLSQAFIVRTCGLYGLAETKAKGNFVKTILRLADERDELRIVNDQRCTPSSTTDVASMIAALIQTTEFGLYHVTNTGATTWYEVAQAALQFAGKSTPVIPIPSKEYPTRAQRPRYSVLDCQKAMQVTGQLLPDWKNALERYVQSLA
ncbi:dTDP-4-dehydrorhamnose reductase [Planctomicrobium sp. SH527]|uniref:dTDP-4-dehydrorhamnose reductase n=1 Tax=Planctomicrobium sp. SH527 TaxID=3448123 RepID=UPI003F5C08C1